MNLYEEEDSDEFPNVTDFLYENSEVDIQSLEDYLGIDDNIDIMPIYNEWFLDDFELDDSFNDTGNYYRTQRSLSEHFDHNIGFTYNYRRTLPYSYDRFRNELILHELYREDIIDYDNNVNTIENLYKKIKNKKFRKIRKVTAKKDGVCPICLSSYLKKKQGIQFYCQHFFHIKCILPWLNMYLICPICRR